MKDVSASITIGGVSANILYDQGGLEYHEDFNAASSTFTLVTNTSGFSINEAVNISMGYVGDTSVMMTGGFVDSITADRPPGTYRIEGRDRLKQATDFFIVEASMVEEDFFNPRLDNGSSSPEDIVGDILDECGLLTGQDLDSTGGAWTFGTAEEGTPFQLKTAWDAIQEVTMIGVWKVWVKPSGGIRFAQVIPEPGVSSGSLTTGDSGNLLRVSYSKSDLNLRNKVVVIGAPFPGPEFEYYTGTASAGSPYLPVGYYKTAVISTDLLTDGVECFNSAVLNRDKLNKLTEGITFVAEGDQDIHIMDTLNITEAFSGTSGSWFVDDITHSVDSNGYTMTGTGVK